MGRWDADGRGVICCTHRRQNQKKQDAGKGMSGIVLATDLPYGVSRGGNKNDEQPERQSNWGERGRKNDTAGEQHKNDQRRGGATTDGRVGGHSGSGNGGRGRV